jgi:nitrous oxidase accessory protein NosD
MNIPNCDRRNADNPAAKLYRQLFLILYRRSLRSLTLGALYALCCFSAPGATFRWASSSNRIYIDGPGSATLSDIKAALPKAPLTLVNSTNKIWYTSANLIVEFGAQLKLYGPAIGGDVAELRLRSDNTSDPNAVVELRADWGYLDIRNTKITSWDNAANGPDTEIEPYRRAYVRARSSLDPDGVTAHESRMDVINSEICYLGSHHTESYGLVWKVVDTTATNLPAGSTQTIFDVVNVYGDILNSHIHDNFFGMYSFGQFGGHFATNEVDHNIGYGFDPHDDSDYLVIENNNVHHNGWHGIIASKRCDHLIIRNNMSWANSRNGIMLHRHCNDSVISGNQSFLNADSGIALFDVERVSVTNNVCLSNSNAGIRLSVDSANNFVANNESGYSGKYGLYLYQGSDAPEPDDTDPVTNGRPRLNVILNNSFHDYGAEAAKLQNSDSNYLIGNTFAAPATSLRFDSSTNNLLASNSLPANAMVKLVGSTTNFTSTLIKGQPQLSLQLDVYSISTFADDGGAIFDSPATISTFVDSSGSFVTLSSAMVGTGVNTILTRSFFVQPDGGGVIVRPVFWNNTGSPSNQWTAQAASGSSSILYRVGDLVPGGAYSVTSDSGVLGVFNADTSGYISFSTAPGTTTLLTYSVGAL